MERYELLASAVVSGIILINKYRSKETGLTVCTGNVDGPLVNGYFCLATEAHDDDGLPHTLEHLVFMGSEEYPFKGMLDLFANRCLAQGTNAWTDIDHTCYTMTTAGSEGFLNLLPIYLDHILYPTLTDSSFLTEVHHINGNGENAGVVYCEMQASENTGHSLTFLEFQRAMYPECGYKSETGGIMKNLRERCSNVKVRNYHARFYRPENLCLIITGNVNPEDVFRVMQPFEEKIKQKGERAPFIRPWINPVPPLDKMEEEKHILFATEDESSGLVLLGWRGPSVLELHRIDALHILFQYLTNTPVAPLQKELVEIDDPLCGDIGCKFLENKETSFVLHFDNVPKESLFDIKTKVLGVLESIATGVTSLDMERMQSILHRAILKEMNNLEDKPHDALSFLMIGDFLYSEKHEHLQLYVDKINRLEQLKGEPSSFWTDLLNNYIIGKKIVVVVGDPSEEYMRKTGEEEKQRVEKQVAELGENGLKCKKEELSNAIAANSVQPSLDIVNKLQIPSPDSIIFFEIKSNTNRFKTIAIKGADELKKFPVHDLPCAFSIHHVKSLFAQVYVLIDTVSLPEDLRMYLPLYTELLFQSPILRDGKLIPYEDVVKELASDTLETVAFIGIGHSRRFVVGSYASLISISFKVEPNKYEACVRWVKDVLFNLQFSAERLKIVANKMISDVANHKRNGKDVTSALIQNIIFTKASNSYVSNMIRQYTFLTQLLKNLEDSTDKVIQELETLRKILVAPENLRFYVAANVEKLPEQPELVWKELLFENMSNIVERVKDVPRDIDFLKNEKKAKAAGIGSVESAYLIQVCDGIDSYEDPDYPAMLVFISYLCGLEGPLWRQIRGCGYSYNYRMAVSPSNGKISFVLAKSTHIFKAYDVAKQITMDFVSGKTLFERGQIEAAISGTIFQIIETEQTIGDAVIQSITSEFRRTSPDFSRVLLKKVSQVTENDLKRVGQIYFAKLFDPSSVSVALCCHPSKIIEIVSDFKGIGVEFDTITSLESEFSS